MRRSRSRVAEPPLRVAFGQALASIRVRFDRQAITTAGIASGTAFFASTLVLRAAESVQNGADSPSASRLAWLAGTSLVMCLVGVTNSMLMAVTERYREIGTIKCLGASDGFIVAVYFLEATILGAIGSFAGAVLGVGLGTIALLPMGLWAPWEALIGSLAIAAIVGIGLTVVSAVLPALQAARMPAVAALGMEV